MKYFVCIVLLAAAAVAAPEGKRDKRGYLSHDPWAPSISFGHSLDLGWDSHHSIIAEPIFTAPKAKIITINKVVEVPKVVEVKKVVSVPKVITVPQVVKVNKVVHEPEIHFAHSAHSAHSGWW